MVAAQLASLSCPKGARSAKNALMQAHSARASWGAAVLRLYTIKPPEQRLETENYS